MIADGEMRSEDSPCSPTDSSDGTKGMRTRIPLTRSELAALSPVARQILNEICLEIAKVHDSADI